MAVMKIRNYPGLSGEPNVITEVFLHEGGRGKKDSSMTQLGLTVLALKMKQWGHKPRNASSERKKTILSRSL